MYDTDWLQFKFVVPPTGLSFSNSDVHASLHLHCLSIVGCLSDPGYFAGKEEDSFCSRDIMSRRPTCLGIQEVS